MPYSRTHHSFSFASFLYFFVESVYAATPQSARWASIPLGPDGPWNAIMVEMGNTSPGQDVTIYPGRMWESYFLGSNYCLYTLNVSQPCYAKNTNAIYNEVSGTGRNPNVNDQPNTFYTDSMQSTDIGSLSRWMDTLHLGDNATETGPLQVNDLSMVILQDTQLQYPNGVKYPLFAGCLGLGAAPGIVNQTFYANGQGGSSSNQGQGQRGQPTNTSLIAGSLFASEGISNSFGLHIGSVKPAPIPGSLWFGGYDKNRAVGEMLTVPMYSPYEHWTVSLADISINTMSGGSPFPWDSKAGFLASGNSSIGKKMNVQIDPCIPYLNLPQSTCDAIAAEFPVTYNNDLGLYLWNTDSDDYGTILQSASVLTFTFLDPNNNSRLVNISVPLMHLNLTLDQPLVETPTPYFPCFTASPNGQYALGRTFLQDAFFGANFEKAVFFMSQAPGPNNLAASSVAVIDSTATTLDVSDIDWTDSWSGTWSPLPTSQAQASHAAAAQRKVNLAVGLTVGLGGGLGLLGATAFLAWRYRKHGKGVSVFGFQILKNKEEKKVTGKDIINELEENLGPQQLPASDHEKAAEMEQPRVVHEMPGDSYWPGQAPSSAYPHGDRKCMMDEAWANRRRSF